MPFVGVVVSGGGDCRVDGRECWGGVDVGVCERDEKEQQAMIDKHVRREGETKIEREIHTETDTHTHTHTHTHGERHT